MDMLNYKQFSERFPICNNGVSSEHAWAELLKRWRVDGKLQEKRHWRYGPAIEDGVKMTRRYDVRRVLRLVVSEYQGGKPRPRIAFLCQSYTSEIADLLNASDTSSTDDKQAVTL